MNFRFSRALPPGGLAHAGTVMVLATQFFTKATTELGGKTHDPRFDWAIRRCAMKITVAARMSCRHESASLG